MFTLTGSDTAVDQAFGLHRDLTVTGVEGGLTVMTDRPAYFADEDITALATLTASGAAHRQRRRRSPDLHAGAGDGSGTAAISSLLQSLREATPRSSLAQSEQTVDARKQQAQNATSNQTRQVELVTYTPITGSRYRSTSPTMPAIQVKHGAVASTPGQVCWTSGNGHGAGIFLWYKRLRDRPGLLEPSRFLRRQLCRSVGKRSARDQDWHAPSDPWTVETDLVHSPSGASLTTRNSYVDGDSYFRLDWDICLPQPAAVSTFTAGRLLPARQRLRLRAVRCAVGFRGRLQRVAGLVPGSSRRSARPATTTKPGTTRSGTPSAPAHPVRASTTPSFRHCIDNGAGLQWDVFVSSCTTVSAFWSFGETPTIPPVEPPTGTPAATCCGRRRCRSRRLRRCRSQAGRHAGHHRPPAALGPPAAAPAGASTEYPFYIHDRDTALTLETDRGYRCGDLVQINGSVSNTSDLTQNALTLVVGPTTARVAATADPESGRGLRPPRLATLPMTLTASASSAGPVTPLVADPVLAAERWHQTSPETIPSAVSPNTGAVPAVVQTTVAGRPVPNWPCSRARSPRPASVRIVADTEADGYSRRRRDLGCVGNAVQQASWRCCRCRPITELARFGSRTLHGRCHGQPVGQPA